MNRVLLILSAAALSLGCGVSTGFLRDATTANNHQYRQEVAAVRYERTAFGSWSTPSVLCVIPFNQGDGAYKEAMVALRANAKLDTNEVLENLREDQSITTYLVYCVRTLTVSADVVALIPPGALIPTSKPRVKSAPPSDESAADSPSSTGCDRAFNGLGALVAPLRRLYPTVSISQRPDRTLFTDACAQQPESVQRCLHAAYLKGHQDDCKQAFEALSSRERRTLFVTFLDEYEE